MTKPNLLIILSIREFPGMPKYSACEGFEDFDIIVVGEDKNVTVIHDGKGTVLSKFFGVRERLTWMYEHGLDKFTDIIGTKDRSELNFATVYAHVHGYNKCVIIDDDTEPLDKGFFLQHLAMLRKGKHLVAKEKWLNPIKGTGLYPRGYPYNARYGYSFSEHEADVVFNQGLWNDVLDLNAHEYLSNPMRGAEYNHEDSLVIPRGVFTTVCGMNQSFKTEIAPAIFNFPRPRLEDIWSGVVLKKILDQMGKSMSFGNPMCYHKKAPRDLPRDIQLEIKYHNDNEALWLLLDDMQLVSKDPLGCMSEIMTDIHWDDDIKFMLQSWIDMWDKVL